MSTEVQRGVFVVTVAGKIERINEHLFRDHMAEVLGKAPDSIIFALSGVEFIDSAGLRCLESAAHACPSVCLKDPLRAVRRMMKVSGIEGASCQDGMLQGVSPRVPSYDRLAIRPSLAELWP